MHLLETHTKQSHKSPSEGWWSEINIFFNHQIPDRFENIYWREQDFSLLSSVL